MLWSYNTASVLAYFCYLFSITCDVHTCMLFYIGQILAFGQKGYTQGFTVVYSLVCMSMHYKIVCIAQYFYNGEGQNFILCQ